MTFNESGYTVIKEAIPKALAEFVYNYFLIKKQVAKTMLDEKYLAPFETIFGIPEGDEQVPGAYAHYGDIAMDTLLLRVLPIMEEKTGLKLMPTYSYARIYQKGSELKRHKDRPSCEISTTLCLGYDNSDAPTGYNWGMFVEKSGEKGKKGEEINMEPGDMIIYRGCEIEHWREPFKGTNLSQVFLHYNDADGIYKNNNKYDGRPMLGLPPEYKEKNNG